MCIYIYTYAQVDEATIITDRQPTLSTPYTRLKTQLTTHSGRHIHNRMYGLHMVTPLTQRITPLVTTQHQHQSISPWLVGLHVSL